jgi:hypothetical protein
MGIETACEEFFFSIAFYPRFALLLTISMLIECLCLVGPPVRKAKGLRGSRRSDLRVARLSKREILSEATSSLAPSHTSY